MIKFLLKKVMKWIIIVLAIGMAIGFFEFL